MSHHASGPDFGFPRGDARLDITDLYVFPKPGDAGKSILILNVHPSVGVKPPGPTTVEPFAPGALYEFRIDTNGDAVADVTFSVEVSFSEGGNQTATLRRMDGGDAAGIGNEGDVLVMDAPVSMGEQALVTDAGDYRFFAGWRSDPFFFDADGFFHEMQFTGDDFFADKNVCSIVLELPNVALGPNSIGLWARTMDKVGNEWIQADRGARPLQAVFLPGERRLDYLEAQPADDARFIRVFAHELAHTGGYRRGDALKVAKTLLPDILSYSPGLPASYPDNGRTLTDDVVDVFFALLTNGKVTGDKVGPHSDLLAVFPYVGPPHQLTRMANLSGVVSERDPSPSTT